MRWRTLLLSAVAVLGGTPASQAARPVKSPADLFPANTVAYAEVRQPGRLMNEIRSLFEGSVLADVPASLADLQAKYDPRGTAFRLKEQVGRFGLFLSTEVAAEVGRLQGAALGLIGITKDGQPEYLGVVLPGESQIPGIVLRSLLAMSPMRPIGKANGVTLYRGIYATGRRNPPAKVWEVGPAVAMMPGVLFIGSPEAVKGAIRRAKGKGEGKALAGVKAFREARQAAGKAPGLFGFINPAHAVPLIGAHLKQLRIDRAAWDAVVKLVNPKAFRADAYSLTLNKGVFRARRTVLFNPKEKSPLLEGVLPAKPVNTALLNFAPRDAVFVAAISNDGGGKRWASLLKLADRLAQLNPRNKRPPSEHLKAVEGKLGIDFGKDVFSKVAAVAFAVGDPLTAPVKKITTEGPNFKSVTVRPEIPMVLVVEATDAGAAKRLVGVVLPKVFSAASGGKGGKPTVKETDGQKIYSVQVSQTRSYHYGRRGKVIVFGSVRDSVVRSLAAGAAKEGWLADARSAKLLQGLQEPVAVAVVKPVELGAAMFLMMRTSSRKVEKGEAKIGKGPKGPAEKKPPQGDKKGVTVRVETVPAHKGLEQFRKELTRVAGRGMPLVLSLTRQEDRVTFEAKLSGLSKRVARLTDFVVEQIYRSFAARKKAPGPKGKAEK
jgi:hypothetical protein